MTAVASPPSFQPLPRLGWNSGNNTQGGLTSMSADEVTRMFMPGKVPERSNSSSSTSSIASSSSATSTSTILSNNSQSTAASRKPEANTQADRDNWTHRKKPVRGLWPSSKAEPVSGLSNGRPQSLPALSSGASAASAMAAIHQPAPILPSQNMPQPTQQMNGIRPGVGQGGSEQAAVLILLPMNGTFERKHISVPLFPDILRIGRQTNAKTVPTPTNGYFDSKVLSRQHAEVWADRNGKIWIRDVKSSNGTFVNGVRLSAENRDSEPHELREQDMLELGIDIVSEDQKSIVHHKVSAKVEHAGIHQNASNVLDLNFGDIDPGSGGGLMGPPFPQHLAQMRGRNGSQGSITSNGRMPGPANMSGSNMNAFGAQRQMNAWLSPITIEQVVRKLTVELKQAKQQSQDLHRTSDFFNALLSHEPGQEPPKQPADMLPLEPHTNGLSCAAKMDPISPYLQPPAPPPRQPLPEKPDAVRPIPADVNVRSSPKRSHADRTRSPMLLQSPQPDGTSGHILSLVEALTSAKREIDSQGTRVKHLEDLLRQERKARENAEERARRLLDRSQVLGGEPDGHVEEDAFDPPPENTAPPGHNQLSSDIGECGGEVGGSEMNPSSLSSNSAESPQVDFPMPRLEEKIELLMREIDEMKLQMEKYRQRAEVAEDSRDGLAEMVERIRKGEAGANAEEGAVARRQSSETSTQTETGSYTNSHPEPLEDRQGPPASKPPSGANGRPVASIKEVQYLQSAVESALASSSHRNDLLVQSAPYASILGVVLIGMGIMTYLNGGWQKVER